VNHSFSEKEARMKSDWRRAVEAAKETHRVALIAAGFEQISHADSEGFRHPAGHEATIHADGSVELRGRSWTQPMPGHSDVKVFKKQLAKLNVGSSSNKGPKAGQSAVRPTN
jgi:hypothetical protein